MTKYFNCSSVIENKPSRYITYLQKGQQTSKLCSIFGCRYCKYENLWHLTHHRAYCVQSNLMVSQKYPTLRIFIISYSNTMTSTISFICFFHMIFHLFSYHTFQKQQGIPYLYNQPITKVQKLCILSFLTSPLSYYGSLPLSRYCFIGYFQFKDCSFCFVFNISLFTMLGVSISSCVFGFFMLVNFERDQS